MQYSEILLIANTVLLSMVGGLLLFLGYFLRDIHHDFKKLIETVNDLSTEQSVQGSKIEQNSKHSDQTVGRITNRLVHLEAKLEGGEL